MPYRVAWGLLVAFLAFCNPRLAVAADPAADALFTSAKALMVESKYAEACPKFEESYRLDPLLGVLLNLAFCLEQEGRVASSWTRWGEASEIAARAGDDRKGYADEHRAATEARLSRLRIVVEGAPGDLKVYRDTVAVGTAMYGTELPVDPGEYTIEVARGDDLLHQELARLGEAESKTVTLSLEEIGKQPVRGRRKGAGAGAGPPPLSTPAEPTEHGLLIAGVVVGTTGVAAALVGGVFGGLALSTVGNTSEDGSLCTTGLLCTAEALDIVREAETFAHVSTGLLAGGGALAALGLVLILVQPSTSSDVSERASTEMVIGATVLPGGGRVALTVNLQ